jgi:nucleotide-binding universal stress UspA family protein
MNKVLCPIDFSPTSLNALEFAAKFCQKASFQLVILNVFTENDLMKVLDSASAHDQFLDLKQLAEEKLKQVVAEVTKEFGLKPQYSLRLGDLIDTIVQMDEQDAFDYVVMGTTGVSNMREAYMGSNTIKVLEKVTVPVICIPQKAENKAVEHIVYATDYSEEDKLIMQQLVSFSVMFNSRIKVVHVTPTIIPSSQAEHKQFVEELSSFVSYQKVNYELIEGKDVPKALDDYMAKNQADMLVLLKKRRTFFEAILHKSVTKRMSYLTDYPLMVFKG